MIRVLFFIAILAAIAAGLPAKAGETVRRTIQSIPWTITLPDGFCALDPGNPHDLKLLQQERGYQSSQVVEHMVATTCEAVKTERTGGPLEPTAMLRYSITSGKEENPVVLKLTREEYLNVRLKGLQKRDLSKDFLHKVTPDVPTNTKLEARRVEVIDRDIYAYYSLYDFVVGNKHEIEIYAETKVQRNPINIQIEQVCKDPTPASTELPCTDPHMIGAELAQLKTAVRSFMAANDP